MGKIKSILNLILIVALIIVIFMVAIYFWENLFADGNSVLSDTVTLAGLSLSTITSTLLLLVSFLSYKKNLQTINESKLPIVNISLVPNLENQNLLLLRIKNTGGGVAYDVNTVFTPNIKYEDTLINELNIFKNIVFLDKEEEISFFLGVASEVFNGQYPKTINVKISYYTFPNNIKSRKKITRDLILNIEERKGQMQIINKNVNHIVKELEELKHALLLNLIKRDDNNV